MLFFFRCNAHAVWHHLVTDDRHVRWHQAEGAPRLATPLSTPPVSSTRDTAADRDRPRYHTESAITYADFRGLSTAPSHTACPGHHRWDTFYNNREQTVISPPWVAVSLWSTARVTPARAGCDPFCIRFLLGGPVDLTEDGQQTVELGLGQAGQDFHLTIVSDLQPHR